MKMLCTILPTKSDFDDSIYRILQQREYEPLRSNFWNLIRSGKKAIRQWFIEMLEKAFANIPSIPSISENLSTIFMIVGLLVLFAVVIIVIVKVSKTFEKKTRIKEILGEAIDARTTPNSLRFKGDSSAKEGDFRSAIRYEFIALLLLMHERKLLYLDESKTNEEIYKYLKKTGFPMLPIFEYLGNTFNNFWYGHRVGNKEIYITWENNISLLWDEVIKYEEKSK